METTRPALAGLSRALLARDSLPADRSGQRRTVVIALTPAGPQEGRRDQPD